MGLAPHAQCKLINPDSGCAVASPEDPTGRAESISSSLSHVPSLHRGEEAYISRERKELETLPFSSPRLWCLMLGYYAKLAVAEHL